MAKNDNLQDFLTDVANSIRTKTGTTDPINAQDFSDKILSIQTGGGEDRLKKLLDTTKSCYSLFFAYQGTSVDDLIQYSDTENVTTTASMFSGCGVLSTSPLLNTSKVTNMSSMFQNWSKLTTIPLLDTSNNKSMYYMFQYCRALTEVPQLNTSQVTNMDRAFDQCTSLTTIPLLDTSNVTTMGSTFSGCKALTTIPLLNTSKVTDMNNMCWNCKALTTIPAFDVNKVNNMNGMFYNCSMLKSILMTNIGVKLDISASTKFERSDLLVILNNLKTVTSATTLTMGADNLAKLTEEDKAIAINKGWTLA